MDFNKTHQAWLEGIYANEDIDILFESTLGVFADEDIAKLFGTTSGESTPSTAITSIGYIGDTPGGKGVKSNKAHQTCRVEIEAIKMQVTAINAIMEDEKAAREVDRAAIKENIALMMKMMTEFNESLIKSMEELNESLIKSIEKGIKKGFEKGFESLRLKANLDNGAQPTVRETQDLLPFDIIQQIPTFDFSSTPSHPFTMLSNPDSCHNTSAKYDFVPRGGISEHDIEGCMKLHDIKGWLKQKSTTSFKHLYHGVIGGMKVHDLTGWLKRIYFMI
jgi:hypothetical protein